MEKLNIPKKKDLKVIPKDEVVTAVVINLESKTWFEFTKDETKKLNLKNPDGKLLVVKYDCNGFIRSDIFPYSENTTDSSKYGKYIEKYGDFEIGQKVKVYFDSEGKSDISLPK